VHSLLKRQLRRYAAGRSIPEELEPLLESVDRAYEEADEDRAMLERSLEISSSELLAANSQMRAALEVLPDRFLLIDTDLTIVECKGGRPESFLTSADQLVGLRLEDVPHRSEADALCQAVERSRRSGSSESAEYDVQARNRRETFEARVLVSSESQIVAIIRNTSASRAASEALARQERFLRHILDLNPGFIYTKDRSGRFTLVNRAVADAFGTTVQDVIGRTDVELGMNPSDAAAIRESEQRAIDERTEITIPEEKIVDRGGQIRWLQTVKVPLVEADGTCRQMLGVSTDITERKQAEARLRDRTDQILRKHTVLEELALSAATAPEETFARLAEIMARALESDRVCVLLFNEDDDSLDVVATCDDGVVDAAPAEVIHASRFPRYLEALRTARILAVREVERDTRLEEIYPEHLAPLRIRSALEVPIRVHGRLVGVVCAQQRREHREWTLEDQDLAASIGDFASVSIEAARRREVEEQLRQSQKMEAIGLLAGGVAHDFNNLLGVIVGYAEMASAEMADDPRARADLEKVSDAARRAADLTSKLLALSRREALEAAPVDLTASVGDFVGLLGRIVGEDVEVVCVTPDQPATVLGDRSQIDQILLNLATNARQAMPRGGRLDIHLRTVELTDEAVARRGFPGGGAFHELVVRDDGDGMTPDVVARLWEPFFTTKVDGTGLGLSLVYGAVESHGGFIKVDSVPGEGSEFRVYLPVADGVGPDRPHERAGTAVTGVETVILAEDEGMLRDLLREGLGKYGYRVVEASDGEEALARLKENPDAGIVVMDVVMPRLGGPEVFHPLRAARPDLPVLFMSGYAPGNSRLGEVLREPMTDLIAKPFGVAELAGRIRALIAESAGTEEALASVGVSERGE
jgi:PAS domain S-box-containing protein